MARLITFRSLDIIIAGLLGFTASLSSAQVTQSDPLPIRTVAFTGQIADQDANHVFGGEQSFGVPGVGGNGEIAFYGRMTTTTSTAFIGEGIWKWSNGSLARILRDGDELRAPNGDPFIIPLWTISKTPAINSRGDVAFQANRAVIRATDQPRVVLRSGIAPPTGQGTIQLSDDTFDFFNKPHITDVGDIAARVRIANGVPGRLIQILVGNEQQGYETAFESGVPMPGLPAGSTITSLGTFDINSDRVIIAPVGLSGLPLGTSEAVVTMSHQGAVVLARQSEPIPGLPGATFARNTTNALITDTGRVAFTHQFTGGPSPGGLVTVLMSGTSESVSALAWSGMATPEFGPDAFLKGIGATSMNNAGQILYLADSDDQSGDTPWGLYLADADEKTLIARAGGDAGNGDTFLDETFRMETNLNEAGQVAFLAQILDGRKGIWATDPLGDLHRIIVEGELLEVAPGDFRTIRLLQMRNTSSSNDGNEPSAFSDDGRIAFNARFFDGTEGIFTVLVPSPSTMGVLIGLGIFVSQRKRR